MSTWKPQNVILFGSKIFGNVIKMISYQIKVGPKPMTSVLTIREKFKHRHTKRRIPYEDTETHREEHYINTETEFGVICL